jgi:hypothetical protein
MIAAGLATGEVAIFDLDFHPVMHWGHKSGPGKHYVPSRSNGPCGVKFRHPADALTRPGPAHQRPDRQGLQDHHPGPPQAATTPRWPSRPRSSPPATPAPSASCSRPGRDAPTVIITNDHHQGPHQPVRPADDHRAAPRRDHPVLYVLAQALLAAFRARLGTGYAAAIPTPSNAASWTPPAPSPATATPPTTVVLSRRAYPPVLRQSDLRADTIVPWWQGRRLGIQFA